MIVLSNVCKTFDSTQGRVVAVDNVSLAVEAGQIYGIIGYSGAGKSTLIRLLNGLETPTSGRIDVGGFDIARAKGSHLRQARLKISMVFQHFNLLWSRTVSQNIAFSMQIAGVPKAQIAPRVAELIALVGLQGREDAYPSQLSGGQKQRVGIARALVHQPQILLCDEATSALDPESTQAILALLRDINRRLGLTIVLITHEMAVIREICDRVVVLECGRIVEQGEVWEVFGDPRHAVTRSLLGSLRAALPADLQARLRQAPGAGDPVLLDLQYTGASRRVPDLLAIARAIGQRVDLLHGGIERIQGRALGRLLLQVGAPPGELPGVLAKAALVADKVEVLGHVAHA